MDWNLSPEEQRVLAGLVEKQITTPEQYPLSTNALVAACNQKSNRDPVMALSDADVRAAVGSLTRRGLARTASGYGSRVSKFEHRFGSAASGLELSAPRIALLAVLMLRGAQTPGELRARTQRLHGFESVAEVEAELEALAHLAQGAVVRRLEREPGKREHRYRHCLGAAEPDTGSESDTPAAGAGQDELDGRQALEDRVAALEQEVAALRAQVETLTERGRVE